MFKVQSIDFYGNSFSGEGLSATHTKIQAIIDADAPKDKTELMSFLGSTNYLSSYIQNYSNHTAVLRNAMKRKTWIWSDVEQTSFESLKEKMIDCQTLSYFDIALPTEVIVDAGPEGLGAILTQRRKDGDINIVGFGSRSLTEVEKRYSQTEKEALSVVFGCEHFHLYLYGSEFIMKTEHKPLLGIMNKPTSNSTARLKRLNLRLQPYKLLLEYIPGKFNSADYLSLVLKDGINARMKQWCTEKCLMNCQFQMG